jgi:hypothetical protein
MGPRAKRRRVRERGWRKETAKCDTVSGAIIISRISEAIKILE